MLVCARVHPSARSRVEAEVGRKNNDTAEERKVRRAGAMVSPRVLRSASKVETPQRPFEGVALRIELRS